jgi:hypothetical protein
LATITGANDAKEIVATAVRAVLVAVLCGTLLLTALCADGSAGTLVEEDFAVRFNSKENAVSAERN